MYFLTLQVSLATQQDPHVLSTSVDFHQHQLVYFENSFFLALTRQMMHFVLPSLCPWVT